MNSTRTDPVAPAGSTTLSLPYQYTAGFVSVIATRSSDAAINTRSMYVVSRIYGGNSQVSLISSQSEGVGVAFTVTITSLGGVVVTNNGGVDAQIFIAYSGIGN